MDKFALFHDSFGISKTSSYFLSLQLDKNGYAFSIVDTIAQRFVAVKFEPFGTGMKEKSYAEKLEQMLKEDAFLNKNYKSVHFGFVTQKSILVPKELFDKQHLKSFFTFNHSLKSSEELHFNYINKAGAYNIFAIPSDLTTSLVNRFPEIQFYHHAGAFIEAAIKVTNEQKIKLPSLHLNINGTFCDIAAVADGELVLHNSEQYSQTEDVLYHLLNVAEQLEIKPSKCFLFSSGDIAQKTEGGKTLRRFFPNLRFMKESTGTQYDFDEVPEHLLANVLNLHQCE